MGCDCVREPAFSGSWWAVGGADVRSLWSSMYDFRTGIATERQPLNYKIANGKLQKIALVKFFTKSETPWRALISRF
jgi:hypothetical protein